MKTTLSKDLARVIREISKVSSDAQKLEVACMRYKEIFAVHPHLIQLLPRTAQAMLLSEQDEEDVSSIPVTTPAELHRFFKG
ncbi:MAG: hypothetical protein ACOY3I_02180 [Verrucomicrobiota bacterium]